MLDHFDETLSRLDEMPDNLRKRAISHVAGLALFYFENPLASGWLVKTISKLLQPDLVHFTAEVNRLLDDTTPAIAEKIWDRWLKDYWEMRLLGKPKSLSHEEATEMVHWALSLGQRLPDALELIQQMNAFVQFRHADILYRIDKKGILKLHPHATARLLLFFFESTPTYFYDNDDLQNMWRNLKASGVAPELLKRLREAMLALGYDPEEHC